MYTETRSGDTTPGSRPGSALSNATGVIRRPTSAPRKPRPASIAGTGVNTPRGILCLHNVKVELLTLYFSLENVRISVKKFYCNP